MPEAYEAIREPLGRLTEAQVIGHLVRHPGDVWAYNAEDFADAKRRRDFETIRDCYEAGLTLGQDLPPFNLYDWTEAIKADPDGIKTGFGELDAGGVKFLPGSVNYIAGHSGHGKTDFLINLALNIAKAEAPVLFISLEIRDLDLHTRFIRTCQGREGRDFDGVRAYIKHGGGSGEVDAAAQRYADISARKLRAVSPEQAAGGSEIKVYISTAADVYGEPPVVLIDYIQLLKTTGERSYYTLAETSHTILAAAKDVGAIVIAGAQARRPTAVGAIEKPPALWDLRESGDLGQDAAVVLGLYSPSAEGNGASAEREKYREQVDVRVLKNRYGPAGAIAELWYYKKTGFICGQAKGESF